MEERYSSWLEERERSAAHPRTFSQQIPRTYQEVPVLLLQQLGKKFKILITNVKTNLIPDPTWWEQDSQSPQTTDLKSSIRQDPPPWKGSTSIRTMCKGVKDLAQVVNIAVLILVKRIIVHPAPVTHLNVYILKLYKTVMEDQEFFH